MSLRGVPNIAKRSAGLRGAIGPEVAWCIRRSNANSLGFAERGKQRAAEIGEHGQHLDRLGIALEEASASSRRARK